MTNAAGRPNLSVEEVDSTGHGSLTQLLTTGPFPEALRAAIKASRLSLDRIQHRLALRGVTISVATLSYWQSGRRRPERPESLEALRHLETVLGVPQSGLSALLGPPRPRGRRCRPTTMMPIDALWARRERVAGLLAQIDTTSDVKLGRISQHDRVEIAANGGQRSVWVRQILRAEQDGPDRWALVFENEDADHLPDLGNLRNCHPGRVVRDDEANIMVAEMMFDRPLTRGETVIMEYQLIHRGPNHMPGSNSFARKFRLPVREYVIEVRFDESNLPARCQQFSVPAGDDAPSRRRNLALDGAHGVHAVALGFGPGVFGVRWEWPE
ncbi:helix-turn-helix domain-containing protein [Umezawaea beigongshangensis]|uniref:helix-turn-helix domain-containing protein n=1 Tax=Umezawaea beigongshangensis TaxID=2780383 RepID=UPI0018F214EF|nr:helix-turn-helix transcriptional regulator [Umezawaea beigongshangensis]